MQSDNRLPRDLVNLIKFYAPAFVFVSGNKYQFVGDRQRITDFFDKSEKEILFTERDFTGWCRVNLALQNRDEGWLLWHDYSFGSTRTGGGGDGYASKDDCKKFVDFLKWLIGVEYRH